MNRSVVRIRRRGKGVESAADASLRKVLKRGCRAGTMNPAWTRSRKRSG